MTKQKKVKGRGKGKGKGEDQCEDRGTERQSQKRKQMPKQKKKTKAKGKAKQKQQQQHREARNKGPTRKAQFSKNCNFQSPDSALATVETLPRQVNGRNSNSHFSYVNLTWIKWVLSPLPGILGSYCGLNRQYWTSLGLNLEIWTEKHVFSDRWVWKVCGARRLVLLSTLLRFARFFLCSCFCLFLCLVLSRKACSPNLIFYKQFFSGTGSGSVGEKNYL